MEGGNQRQKGPTPSHLVCSCHVSSLPIFKAPCLVLVVSTVSLATLPGLTLCLRSIWTPPLPGWSFTLPVFRLLLNASHYYQLTYFFSHIYFLNFLQSIIHSSFSISMSAFLSASHFPWDLQASSIPRMVRPAVC